MKKITAIFLFAIIFMLCGLSLADTSTPDTILFRNIPWLTPYSEAKPILDSIDGAKKPWYKPLDEEARIDSWFRQWKYFYTTANVTNGGVELRYNGVMVAGYSTSLTVSFIRPIKNDKVQYDTDVAMLYKGAYTIEDLEDMEGAFNDLVSKLSKLYGTPVDKSYYDIFNQKTDPKGYLWTANDGSCVWIGMYWNGSSDRYDEILLVYAAPGTDEMLIALNEQMQKETAEAEAEERDNNASNFDGL